MAKLELYLKGTFCFEMDIDIPPFKDLVDDVAENFELNCKLREDYIKHQATVFRVTYIRQILKCNHEYEIYLVLRSKVGKENLITDSII